MWIDLAPWLPIIIPIVGAWGLSVLVKHKRYRLALLWSIGFWLLYWAPMGQGAA